MSLSDLTFTYLSSLISSYLLPQLLYSNHTGFLFFLKHIKLVLALGPLHFIFPLSGLLLIKIFTWKALLLFRYHFFAVASSDNPK